MLTAEITALADRRIRERYSASRNCAGTKYGGMEDEDMEAAPGLESQGQPYAAWEEAKHPRDDSGQFSTAAGGGAKPKGNVGSPPRSTGNLPKANVGSPPRTGGGTGKSVRGGLSDLGGTSSPPDLPNVSNPPDLAPASTPSTGGGGWARTKGEPAPKSWFVPGEKAPQPKPNRFQSLIDGFNAAIGRTDESGNFRPGAPTTEQFYGDLKNRLMGLVDRAIGIESQFPKGTMGTAAKGIRDSLSAVFDTAMQTAMSQFEREGIKYRPLRCGERTDLARRFNAELARYAEKWDESKHPRASDGRFGTKAGASNPKGDTPVADHPQQASQPQQQPQQEQKSKWRTDSPKPDFSAIHKAFPPANPNGVDTQQKYKLPDGSYTPERQNLHKEIIGGILKGVSRSQNPTVYMMGGGPAAGKSSILGTGDVNLPENSAEIDPDGIKFQLPEMQEMIHKSDTAANYNHEESSEISKAATRAARDMGADIVMDGTGDSSFEKLATKVKEWRAKGHRIQAHYVTVDTDEAWRRAAARAEKTGRKVPESVVRGTHASVSSVFPQAVEAGLFDDFSLWDTNGGKPVKIASGQGTNLQVHHPEAYQRFLDKANQ